MSTTSIQSANTVSFMEQEDENPFVGLRPFEAEESYLFFGRGKQTTELLQKLYTTRFIGVVGSSGCGKSSLIKAGLIPILKAGFLTNERDKWIIAKMRPAGNPLLFLAEALSVALNSSEFIRGNKNQALDYKASFLKEIHEKGVQGIIDTLLPEFEKTPCNLLLLVDQFEELFTTRRNDEDAETQMNENVIFVNILLSLSRQKVLPVYVVITMRSDYIGNCNKFYGLPEILNEGQYLVPRLNRQQLSEVIELPIKLYGEKISARLLDQVLNDSDKDLDQLPVLQHALMRTHKFWMEENKTGVIDFASYQEAGKLDKALSNHANEVYDKLDSTQKKIAELVFRSLTDVNADNDPIRRRQSLEQLTEVCKTIKNVSGQEVEEVINKFRDHECAFLTPFTGKLKGSTIIDISHESLMRQWDKLKEWMNKEQSLGRKFKWLTESVNNNREFLRGIDLSDALMWKEKQPPNEQWASRYQGNYEVVENYIVNSKKKARNNKYLKNLIIGIFIIAPVAAYALYHSYKLKNLSEQNLITQRFQDSLERNNHILKNSLVKLDSSLAHQKKLQEDLNKSYEEKKLIALNNVKSAIAAERQRDENERKERLQEQEKKNREEVETLKLDLKKEPFYSDLYKQNQSFDYGDAVVNALTSTYIKDKKEYNKFRQAIIQVFKAKEIVNAEPVTALRMSKKVWEHSKNPVIDSTIKQVLANKIYYKQKIAPSEESKFKEPSLFISNDKTSFSINDVSNKIYTGKLSKDSLSMDENFNYSYINSFSAEDTVEKSNTTVKSLIVKDNTILGIENDGKLSIWADGKKRETGSVPDIHEFTITKFSPDQNYLITAPGGINETNLKQDSAVILWVIEDLKQNPTSKKIILDTINTRVKQITFAPNSKQFFVLDNDYLKIYDIDNIDKKEPVKIDGVSFAQFSESGNYIITISSGASVNVIDSIGHNTTFRSQYLGNKYLNDLKSFSVSPDWKKILLKQDGKFLILEREGNDSILTTDRNITSIPIKLHSIYSSPDKNLIATASFISNNSILSVDNNGNIFLWKTYPDFENIDDALNNMQLPDSTIAEKLEEGSPSFFKEIESSKDEHTLREAAVYFEKKSNSFKYHDEKNFDISIDHAIIFYNKLLNITNGNKQLYYLDRLTTLKRNFDEIHSTDPVEQMMMVKVLNENVELFNNQIKSNPKDSALLAKRLSMDYNELAFHLIFIKKYDKSIEACYEGLKINPANNILYTNMALAFLLSKNFTEAEKIYNTYKDKWIQSITLSLSFKEAFLQDFEEFERAGIITPKEKDVYDKVKDIKKLLENVADTKDNIEPEVNLRAQSQ